MPGISNGVLYCDNFDFTGAANPTSQMTADGELIIGDAAGNPQVSTLTAGTGIAITNGAGSISISSTGGGFSWNEEVGNSFTIAIHNGYIVNNAALVTGTLPATAAIGDSFQIVGKGAGGWKIAQNATQKIYIGNQVTTTGGAGNLASNNQRDSIEIVCITANTEFQVIDFIGNITVT